jgi:putative endonuclease
MAGLVPAIHVLRYFKMAGGYVYILANRPNGILYVGVTSDLVRRIFEHRSGFVDGFTKHWPRAWKVRKIVAMNPDWDDLFDTITK